MKWSRFRSAAIFVVVPYLVGAGECTGSLDSSGLEDTEITVHKSASVSGVVEGDAGGTPVGGAQVWVASRLAVTDLSGAFYIDNIRAGEQTLTIQANGFAPFARTVSLNPGANALGRLRLPEVGGGDSDGGGSGGDDDGGGSGGDDGGGGSGGDDDGGDDFVDPPLDEYFTCTPDWNCATLATNAHLPALAIDASGAPSIAFSPAWQGVEMATKSNFAWTTGSVDASSAPSGISIAVGVDQQPRLVQLISGEVGYLSRQDGEWVTEPVAIWEDTIPTTIDPPVVLRLGTDGRSHVLFTEPSTSQLHYAVRTPSGWASEAISPAGTGIGTADLVVDVAGGVHIAYSDVVEALFYGYRTDVGWALEQVDGDGRGGSVSLAVGDELRPRIAYYNNNPQGLRYAEHDGSAWNLAGHEVPSELWGLAMAVDGAGASHIAYVEVSSQSMIRHFVRGQSHETVATDNGGIVESDLELAIAEDGTVHLAWVGDQRLRHASRPVKTGNRDANGNWVTNNRLPTLSWEPLANAATYTFILSTNPDLSTPIVEHSGVGESNYTLATALPETASTTYYWAVVPVDSNDVSGERSAIEHFVLDTVAPSGIVTINGGDAETSKEAVSLTVDVSDANEITGMRLAAINDLANAPEQAFASSIGFDFGPAGDEATLTIYATVRDVAGNVSLSLNDSIALKRTLVSGVIDADTIWTAAASPYVLTGDVGVTAAATLTIEAGTRVEYSDTFQLLVKGALIAEGSAGEEIVFTKRGTAPAAAATALLFEDSVLANSSVTHVVFEDVGTGLQVGDETSEVQAAIKNSGTLMANNVTLVNSLIRTSGYNTTAAVLIDELVGERCTIIGEYQSSEAITLTNANLTDCVVKADAEHRGFTFTDSTLKGGQVYLGCCDASIDFVGSALTEVAVVEDGSPVNGPMSFDRCTLTDTSVDLPATRVNMTDTVYTVTAGADPYATTGLRFGGGAIEQCSFTRAEGATAAPVGVMFTGFSGFDRSAGAFTLNLSSISGFETGLLLSSGSSAAGTITNCNLAGNAALALDNRRAPEISATGNYWGATTANAINSLIFDAKDSIESGTVLFEPFRVEPAIDTGPR